MPYNAKLARLRACVLEGPGVLPPEVRRDIAANCAPEALAPLVSTIHRRAVEVTDEHLRELRGAYSDDALFEVTVAAATGAGLVRIDAVFRALA